MTTDTPGRRGERHAARRSRSRTAFLALFSIVGFALYGLPFFYDFFVQDLGWTRQQVTSGNALSKLVVGPLFGFFAGVLVDRFGPRRLMLVGILMAGARPRRASAASRRSAGSTSSTSSTRSATSCGGPLPEPGAAVALVRRGRGKAMGIAYLGIGIGGALVPLVAHALTQAARLADGACAALGVLIVVIAFPAAFFVREPESAGSGAAAPTEPRVVASRAASVDPGRPAPAGLLPAGGRQHGLDRRRGRHDAEPEALPRRSTAACPQGRDRRGAVARPRRAASPAAC